MAKTHSLRAEDRKRTGSGVLKRMRREGFIPSVVYGGGSENRNVKVSAKGVREMLADTASTNVLVDLELDGGSSQLAFLKDLQHEIVAQGHVVEDVAGNTREIPAGGRSSA